MLDPGCWILDAGFSMLDSGCGVIGSGLKIYPSRALGLKDLYN
jgi:hypothetical protein